MFTPCRADTGSRLDCILCRYLRGSRSIVCDLGVRTGLNLMLFIVGAAVLIDFEGFFKAGFDVICAGSTRFGV